LSIPFFLFGPPGSGGFDLASLNIQRGRDLADCNTVRAAYGLPRVTTFAQITSNTNVQAKLQQLYGSVSNIGLWVGGLAEDHVAGGGVGPLFTLIIVNQFAHVDFGNSTSRSTATTSTTTSSTTNVAVASNAGTTTGGLDDATILSIVRALDPTL
jgi:hypothetical protein